MFYLPNNTTSKEIETLFIEGLKIQIWECLPIIQNDCPSKRDRFFYTVEDRIVGARDAEKLSKIRGQIRWTFCLTKAEVKSAIKDIEKQFESYNKWKSHEKLSHRAKEPMDLLAIRHGILLQ